MTRKFTKREILDVISKDENIDSGVTYILSKMNLHNDNVHPGGKKELKSLISSLRTRRNSKFQAAKRMKSRFEMKNAEWLDSEFVFDYRKIVIDDNNAKLEKLISPAGPGRPVIDFNNMSDRSKRRDASRISAELKHDPQRIMNACRYAANYSGNRELYAILGEAAASPAKIKKLIDTPQIALKPKTPTEALQFMLKNSMSKSSYMDMRLECKLSGADIWPTYNVVREAKLQCRPSKEDIVLSEKKADVSLQSLLEHTARRLIKLQYDVIIQNMQNTNVFVTEAVLMCSWGFDGSSGYSTYKQSYTSTNGNPNEDENLFVTVMIPLRLSTTNVILWNNRISQSASFCRPISLHFVRESRDVILQQKSNIEEQIRNLKVVEIKLDDVYCIRIHFSLFLTLIDGKVLNIITNTKSMQTCPICHATPKQFNDISNKHKQTGVFLPDPNSLQYGISPLHAWIRIFECVLHISYRLDIKAWQVRSNEQKAVFVKRKKVIQQILWENMGLIVDKPKIGGYGTTNDGNTARRAFENPTLFAQYLGLDCQLVCNLKTILVALSCHLPVDPVRFDKFCTVTAQIYVKQYSWFPMPSTLHKILMHGAEIINTSVLPVGMLGEEGSEARNKHYKNYRRFHSRQHSREVNLYDIFYRAMDTSDPIIATVKLNSQINKRKQLSISQDVRDLLHIPDVEVTPTSSSNNEENDSMNLPGLPITFQFLDDEVLSGDEEENTEFSGEYEESNTKEDSL